MRIYYQRRKGWELQRLLMRAEFDCGTSSKPDVAAELTLTYNPDNGECLIVELTAEELRAISRLPGEWRKS